MAQVPTGTTIFINSHLLAEVETFCEEVAILKKGNLALQGLVHDLTTGKGYRLTAAAVPEQLREELAKSASSVAARNGFLDFQFATRELTNDAVDQLRREKCEIEAITPTTSTLEDVFVATIGGAPQGESK